MRSKLSIVRQQLHRLYLNEILIRSSNKFQQIVQTNSKRHYPINANRTESKQMKTDGYVIYDCDAGADDAWGLQMLIKWEELLNKLKQEGKVDKTLKILAVTCVQGNTDVENSSRNVLRVLESVDRNDLNVLVLLPFQIPVYKGCAGPLKPRTSWQYTLHYHGKNGFGDVQDLPDVDMSHIQQKHAVNAMYEFVCKKPGQVDFVMVGPLTNLAMCVLLYGPNFLNKIRNIYIMGGNYQGRGNATPSAEFNVRMDPEAAFVIWEKTKRPLPILPWETCIEADLGLSVDWRLNVLGSVNSEFIKLMNKVESAILIPKGFTEWIVCDAELVAAYILPQLIIANSRIYSASVELAGTDTRGQMVINHLIEKHVGNAEFITELHKEHFRRLISWTGGLLEDCEIENLIGFA
uniref:IU_nuc_hydro domain-containing protein n=1 Tax=Glossina brevipalpis TaxID=37001 RepID=A0A1A9WCC1_9MUSC